MANLNCFIPHKYHFRNNGNKCVCFSLNNKSSSLIKAVDDKHLDCVEAILKMNEIDVNDTCIFFKGYWG